LIISVPEGKHIDIQRDIDNYFNLEQSFDWPWDGKPVWTMTNNGLTEKRPEVTRLASDTSSLKQNIKTP